MFLTNEKFTPKKVLVLKLYPPPNPPPLDVINHWSLKIEKVVYFEDVRGVLRSTLQEQLQPGYTSNHTVVRVVRVVTVLPKQLGICFVLKSLGATCFANL